MSSKLIALKLSSLVTCGSMDLMTRELSGSCPSSSSASDGDACQDHDVSADVSTTLYFGNLHPFVQQRALEDLCSYFGLVDSAKVIKDKGTGTSAGYGFVRFSDKASAEAALQALNGQSYLGEELRVNWALPNNHKEDTSHHHHVFVGDLSSDVTDAVLYNTFCTVGQCSDARVMWDHSTGRSKGYGFISFRRKEDAEAAIEKMQGKQIGARRIRVGWAQHKQDEGSCPPDFSAIDRADPCNTNVYIGNIAPETSEADLHAYFSVYGPVAEVKLHKKGGYGFVKYEAHESAVKAIVGQHGKDLHGRVLKCSWGKNIASSRLLNQSASASSALSLATALQNTQLSSTHLTSAPALTPASAQSIMASLAATAAANAAAASRASASQGQQLPRLCGFQQQQQQHSGALPMGMNLSHQHLSGGMPTGLLGLPNDVTAAQALAGGPHSLLALMYQQAAMSQGMSPMALAAQVLLMQQSQESLGMQATMAALAPTLAVLNNSALTSGNMALDPPGLYQDAGHGMYGGHGLYGFPGGNHGMLLH